MITLFLFYCLAGAIGLTIYGSPERSDSAVRDWVFTILLVLGWPLIMLAVIYRIFFSRKL